MNMYGAVLIQIVIVIAVIYFVFRLINAVFRIAKALDGIDETLYQIHNKLEDKSKSTNNKPNKP